MRSELKNPRSTCSLDIGGLYDPPTALSQQLVYPTPTVPIQKTTDTAKPGGGPTSKSAPATAEPITTPGSQSPSQQSTSAGGEPNPPSTPTGGASQTPGTQPNQPQTSQGQSPEPAATTTARGIGSIIASVLGISRSPQVSNASPNDPAPATTTNAESILSAAQSTFADPGSTADLGSTADPGSIAGPGSTADPDPTSAHGSAGGPVAGPTVITANGNSYTIAPVSGSTGVYVVDGSQTVTQGSSGVTINGVAISAASSGQIVAGSQTAAVGAQSQSQSQGQKTVDFFTGTDGSGLSVSSVSGSTGVYEVGGTTISAGGPAKTIDGVKVSAASNGVVTMGSPSAAGSASISGAAAAASSSTSSAVANRGSTALCIWLACLACSTLWLT